MSDNAGDRLTASDRQSGWAPFAAAYARALAAERAMIEAQGTDRHEAAVAAWLAEMSRFRTFILTGEASGDSLTVFA